MSGAPPIVATVEVAYTDRTIRDGAFVTRTRTVDVLADTEVEAHQVAALMVYARIPDDFMVTSTTTIAIAI